MGVFKRLFILAQFSCLAVPAYAQQAEGETRTKATPTEKTQPDPSVWQRWHNRVSSRVLNTANQIDLFLANDRLWEEVNRSYLLVDQRFFAGFENRYDFNVRAHLSLPNTENRISLFLENEENEIEDYAGIDNNETIQDAEGTNVGARVRFLGDRFDNFNFHTRVAVQTRGLDLKAVDPYAELRMRYRWDINDQQLVEAHFKPAYFVQARERYLAGLNYDNNFQRFWLFRVTNNFTFTRENPISQWSNGLGLFYTVATNKVISTSAGASSNDLGGAHITGYNTSVGYRQNIGYPWLTMQTSAGWTFPKAQNFRRQFQALVFLQIRFGYI